MLVDVATAQQLFSMLPAAMRWTTMSPAYVAADARRSNGVCPLFLVAKVADGWLLHGVHEEAIPGEDACDWQSAYGYGGPLAYNLDNESLATAWQEFKDLARERRVVAEFVRFHPMLANERNYPGEIRQDRPVVVVQLDRDDLLASYSGRARTSVRKAQNAGLHPVWESPANALAHFPDFYRRCMNEIGATDFYQFGDHYFSSLMEVPGAKVLSVMRDRERLAMGLFLFGPEQVEYHLSGTTLLGRQHAATNLLVHVAATTAQALGFRRLYLGGGRSTSHDDALLSFKRSFSATEHMFSFGYRIHDPSLYQRMREKETKRGVLSRRVLFYRE